MRLIAGVDEAGRGPLAGPVSAAAVILPDEYDLPGLNDSKKLSEKRRETLAEAIKCQAVAWSVVLLSAQEIDRLNILQATLSAMSRAITDLMPQPHQVLVDGNQTPNVPLPVKAIIGGDALEPAISAASILAKVARDQWMLELHEQYPVYGFDRHKGYPTKLHMLALQEHGPCPEHRRSFAPVTRVLVR